MAGIAAARLKTLFREVPRVALPASTSDNPIVRFDAKPEPIAIDIGKAAVIVVDMQNDFGTKGGMFDRAGLDISMIQKAVGPTAKVLALARRAGAKIVYLKMGFHPDLSDLGSPDSPNRVRHLRLGVGKTVRAPDGSESRILIRDTWNTDIVPELKPQAVDIVMYKHRFSGFYQTDLDATLKQLEIQYLIVTGCTTSVCVESTVRDALFRDYACVLLADCMGEPIGYGLPRTNHEASLLTMQTLFGWVSGSDQFATSCRRQVSPTVESLMVVILVLIRIVLLGGMQSTIRRWVVRNPEAISNSPHLFDDFFASAPAR